MSQLDATSSAKPHAVPARPNTFEAVIYLDYLDARYLAETPANVCTPAYMAEAAQSTAAAAPDVMQLEVRDLRGLPVPLLPRGLAVSVGRPPTHECQFFTWPKQMDFARARISPTGAWG